MTTTVSPSARSARLRGRGGAVRALLVLLAAVMMGTVGAVVAPSPAAASQGDVLYAYAPGYATRGEWVRIHVSWVYAGDPVTGRVNLQRREGDHWRHVRQVAVTDGAATVIVTPGSSNTYRFRTSSVSSPQGVPRAHPDGTSPTVHITVTTRRDLAAAPELITPPVAEPGAAATARIRWYRGASPITGRVNLQRWTSAGWQHVRQVQVTNGEATTTVATSSVTSYRLRASSVSSSFWVTTSHPYGTSATARLSSTVIIPEEFTFVGAGWGHGVGMSQYGAYGMALDGFSTDQILTHYYQGARVQHDVVDELARIQVLDAPSTTTIRVSGGPARVRLGGSIIISLDAGEQVRVRTVANGLRVESGGRTWTTASTANRVHVEWAATRYFHPSRTSPVVAQVSGAQGSYRHGRLELKNIDGRLNVVDVVRIAEEYMLGIAEMPSSWSAAALRAQVIAARSYALATMPDQPRAACDCHLYDDPRSQNFTGWEKENEGVYGERWADAVAATITPGGRSAVLTYGGQVVQAFYFSSSGGRTQNSEEVWSATVPYLRSVDDHWSLQSRNPNSSWRMSVGQETVARAFGLDDVRSLRVITRTEGDGVRSIRATASNGAVATLTGEQMRSRLGLRSTWVSSIG